MGPLGPLLSLLSTLLVSLGPLQGPGDLQVELRPGIALPPDVGVEVEVVVTDAEGRSSSRVVTLPGAARLRAPGVVQVEVRQQGWWAVGRTVVPRPGEREVVVLDVFPTGGISWRFPDDRRRPPPEALSVRFQPTPNPGSASSGRRAKDPGAPAGPAGVMACHLKGLLAECEVPTGEMDLVISAPGHAPHFVWGVHVEAGKTRHLGEIVLVPGASISGAVLSGETAAPIENAQVALGPVTVLHDPDPGSRTRAGLRRLETLTDAEGAFRLEGILPGGYRLMVEKDGFAPFERRFLEIADAREHRLEEPLLLGSPASLEVHLTPPVDPYGGAWEVRLSRLEAGRTYSQVQALPGRADDAGNWLATDLAPGIHLFQVGTGLDPSWHTEEIEIEAGTEFLPVDLPVVAVEGELSSGDEPLAGTLWFGGRHGERSIRMDADVHGAFEGYLPGEGEWEVELECEGAGGVRALDPIQVERAPGQQAAHISIEVPDTVVRGKVVDDSGAPQPGALLVLLRPSERRREAFGAADTEGRFEFRGLAPGRLTIQAESPLGTSAWTPIDLEDGADGADLLLRISPSFVVTGRVVSPSGAVPGVTVTVAPVFAGSLPVTPRTAVTRADGSFTLELPESVEAASVLVFPPGFAASVFGRRFSPEERFVELPVEAVGGTLRLELPPPEREGAGRTALLLHRGAIIGIEQLVDWIRAQGGRVEGKGTLTVPAVEPGEYRLCTRSLLAPASAGMPSRCADGYLVPAGELILDLGEDEAGSAASNQRR